jgi:ketosteroid isomerase-like protein
MSKENVEIVWALNEGFNRGDAAAGFRLFDPDVEAESHRALGGDREYRGHTGMSQLMGTFWQSFENPRSEIEECITSSDDLVLGVRIYGRGRASGVEVDALTGQVLTLRGGKVVRRRVFVTKAEALEAAGLLE